jgi:hypothetical protein
LNDGAGALRQSREITLTAKPPCLSCSAWSELVPQNPVALFAASENVRAAPNEILALPGRPRVATQGQIIGRTPCPMYILIQTPVRDENCNYTLSPAFSTRWPSSLPQISRQSALPARRSWMRCTKVPGRFESRQYFGNVCPCLRIRRHAAMFDDRLRTRVVCCKSQDQITPEHVDEI